MATSSSPARRIAGALSERIGDGLPLSELSQLLTAIPTVTEEQVRDFATQTLAPEKARLVIVGNAKQFLPALQKAFGPVTIWKKWSG